MDHSLPPPKINPAELVTLAARLVEMAAAMSAAPAVTTPDDDAPLPEAEVVSRRPGVSVGWLRGHVTACGRGARRCRLYRLADVDRALASSPVPPRPRKCQTVDGEDPISAMVASGELVSRRGTR
jgi:hypothetical protein